MWREKWVSVYLLEFVKFPNFLFRINSTSILNGGMTKRYYEIQNMTMWGLYFQYLSYEIYTHIVNTHRNEYECIYNIKWMYLYTITCWRRLCKVINTWLCLGQSKTTLFQRHINTSHTNNNLCYILWIIFINWLSKAIRMLMVWSKVYTLYWVYCLLENSR